MIAHCIGCNEKSFVITFGRFRHRYALCLKCGLMQTFNELEQKAKKEAGK
jgi:hypothetical protein